MEFKISLKAARVNANMTQGDVARHLYKNKQTVVNWEAGRTPVDYVNLNAMCSLYKIDPRYIFLPCELG
jgi:transcriptional regulator with XRE-family HTH domain